MDVMKKMSQGAVAAGVAIAALGAGVSAACPPPPPPPADQLPPPPPPGPTLPSVTYG
ncbi:hypothetical protein [Mycolicibacterium cosmeticum]|uniref:Uncharacterized protein n=1 Tax=Mycolicibacterium cosmeticum TaxID=258533 RepID=W9ARF3_MYCCO|nr:hypothetical protein [Mycolicibacterium cosmeticum]CDO05487.1 hypothetical protein BN977_00260 [Mycolicibacterium cosmeticum]